MILQNIKIKSFFLNKNLEIPFLILFISLLFSLLPTSVHAAAAHAVQVGNNAHAAGGYSIAIGHDAQTQAEDSIIIGYNAGEFQDTVGLESIGIGTDANPHGNYALAIGPLAASHGTQAAENASAIGPGARATAPASTAIGYNAFADNQSAVALGAHSQSHAAYTVSVGSGQAGQPHQYRRITNVDTPVFGNDVATKEYIDNHGQSLSSKFDAAEQRINNLGAMQMSIASAQVQIPSNKHTAIGVGVGSYRGSSAATVGFTHQIPGRLTGLRFTGNFTVANAGEKEGGVGIGYSF